MRRFTRLISATHGSWPKMRRVYGGCGDRGLRGCLDM